MKILVLFLIAASTCAAQSVGFSFGPGFGAFNNVWKYGAPVWSAGVLVDNPMGDHGGTMIGLHYRQRGEKNTTLHAVQFDIAGQYIGTRIRTGAGAFFALSAGTRSDTEPPQKLGSGVGVSGFFAVRVWRNLSARIVYDHGLGNLSDDAGRKVTAQAAYLLIEYRLLK